MLTIENCFGERPLAQIELRRFVMLGMSNNERMNLSNAKALRRCRELLKVKRSELAQMLNLTHKAVEKFENGRIDLDEEKIERVLRALNLTKEQFKKIKKGKSLGSRKAPRIEPLANSERRSYQRIISKEVKVLRSLRKMMGMSQDQASAACGYSRPSIGHIENGRIELGAERIKHIVASYGYEMTKFEELMNEEVLRDEIIDFCHEKIQLLPEAKLKLIQTMLINL